MKFSPQGKLLLTLGTLDQAGETLYLAARTKIRGFEESVAARLTRPEQKELARLLAKLQGDAGAA